ncbi:Tetratricopeptide repeat protein 12 [Holothuria leucospilota]|uniref:Tetratricopeptide repeat protein 12 n=1 Tax=Holothuria leucospilota TaxID=206669 RepID=A0A9Q0YDX2_HOLLE|nr:Tetratricopeptide repeat protein 12 [Holothuria leucospilota]
MATSEELEDFLRKVDHLDAVVRGEVTEEDMRKEKTPVNKTVITKDALYKTDVQANVPLQKVLDQQTFLKSIETDAAERAVRRKEKTKIAVKLKEEGNKAFKEGDYETAVKFYSEGLTQIRDMVVLYTNRAQAYLHLKRHTDAEADCETALMLDPACTKAYVHKGRALVGQKQYDQAVTVYTAILNHHPNKRKLVDEYIRQAQQAKDANAAETKAHQLFLEGDTHANNVVDVLDKLRSEGQPTVYYGGGLAILAEILKDDVSRTLYRTNCGLNIFTENRTISSGIQKVIKGSKDVTELELVLSALDVMDRSIIGNDENLSCLLKSPFIQETVFGLMSCASESIVYKCVILLLKMSFQPLGLTGIFINFDIQRLMVLLLTFIQTSNVGTKEGAALLCNIAEDKQFAKVIHDGVGVTVLPALENVMVKHKMISDGVMSSCLSFIGNMAHDCLIRKKISERNSLTDVFIEILSYHGGRLSNPSSQSMLHLVLGLLMNVTIDSSLPKEQSESLAMEIIPLLYSTDESLLEKLLIMISRLVPQSPALIIPSLIHAGILEKLQQNLEGGSTDLKKPSIRLLALLTQGSTDLRNGIAEDKAALERISMLLDEDDDTIIANTALCLGHCFEVKEAIEMLEDTDIVRTLLKKTDTINGTVKQNCAIALAKLAMSNQRHLERVRELGGIGILHSCMKYVK